MRAGLPMPFSFGAARSRMRSPSKSAATIHWGLVPPTGFGSGAASA